MAVDDFGGNWGSKVVWDPNGPGGVPPEVYLAVFGFYKTVYLRLEAEAERAHNEEGLNGLSATIAYVLGLIGDLLRQAMGSHKWTSEEEEAFNEYLHRETREAAKSAKYLVNQKSWPHDAAIFLGAIYFWFGSVHGFGWFLESDRDMLPGAIETLWLYLELKAEAVNKGVPLMDFVESLNDSSDPDEVSVYEQLRGAIEIGMELEELASFEKLDDLIVYHKTVMKKRTDRVMKQREDPRLYLAFESSHAEMLYGQGEGRSSVVNRIADIYKEKERLING